MKKIFALLSFLFLLVLSTNFCFAGAFVSDSLGIKYDVGGNRYLENGWAWCDPSGTGIGYCYYFSPAGYMLAGGAAPDGQVVDAAGRLTVNGVVQTQNIQPLGYELVTASYNLTATNTPNIPSVNLSLASRLLSKFNAEVVSYTTGNKYYPEAIEFVEGGIPSITFNSGVNTSLTFDLTGDEITDPADFVLDVYVNGVFTNRISQSFIELSTKTINFPQNSVVQITFPVINDYYDTYVRRVYILSPVFG